MYASQDTIVALATLAGRSALNVVRVSGTHSSLFFKRLTKSTKKPKPNYVYPKYVYAQEDSNPFDYATLVYYRGPKSFTGEDSLEITVHGGLVIANKLIEELLAFGARQSEPGEFSYRAFINNKIDLLQAEAISSIVSANNSLDSYYWLGTIKGSLSKILGNIKKRVEDIIVLGEHEIDFTEAEMDSKRKKNLRSMLVSCTKEIEKILQSSYVERKTRAGVRIAVVGLPNAGKSSLCNKIIGESKSIVSKEQGTTRDTIETEIYIGSTLVSLVDTAGIRESKSEAESLGVQKTYNEIAQANILIIIDSLNPKKIKRGLRAHLTTQQIVLVYSKTDLATKIKREPDIYYTSCKNMTGIKKLITGLCTLSNTELSLFRSKYSYLINTRQRLLLKKIYSGLKSGACEYSSTSDLSVCLSSLYLIQKDFDALIRPSAKNKILNNIFRGFCVGK